MLSTLCLLSFATTSQERCFDMHIVHTEPLGYIDENNVLAGVQVDYLEALEKVSGVCIKKRLMPYARIWKSIEQGRHDGGFIFKDPTRSRFVRPIDFALNIETWVIPKRGLSIDNYQQLTTLVIGKARATNLSNKFDNDDTLTIVEVNNYDQLPKMLVAGRVDAIAGSEPILRYQLAKLKLGNKVNLDGRFILGHREQWLQLSLKPYQQQQLDKLKKGVEQLRNNHTFSKIMDSYFIPIE